MSQNTNFEFNKLTDSYFHHASSASFQYKTVAKSFDQVAIQHPNHVCYIFKDRGEDKRYTYAMLKQEIDCVAYSLIKLGFKKNDRIGIFLPNSSENIIFTYVASKIGLIRVHINPFAVRRELTHALKITGCKGIVLPSNNTALNTLQEAMSDLDHQSELKNVITLEHIILIGANSDTIKNAHTYDSLIKEAHMNTTEQQAILDERQLSIDPSLPLSILLTSGTTGESKAAVLTNFSVINIIASNWYHFGSICERSCAPLSMFHVSASIWLAMLPSFRKGTIIVPALIANTEATMRAIDEEKCTFFMSNPTLIRNIFSHPDRDRYNLGSIQYIALGSTTLQPQFLRELESKFGINRVGQLYGMTETGPLTDSFHCEDDRRHTSVGRCMPHVEIKIVDNDGRVVSIKCIGEIYARSRFMMRNYYEDKEKTTETITEDGWLRTGDMGMMDEDGYVFFIGRKKELIIRGGTNIWPFQIEKTIEEHHSVAEAYVFSISDLVEDENLCTSVKLKPGAQCEVNELKSFLADKLSSYKIPTHIHFVEEFNRTSIGKVSKPKLAEELTKILRK
ncbi:hypothetical protein I4U23_022162 [Adineta vaga]|nr:hypothetical protein I4U23_022162 [Adineta vaga]